MFFKHALGNSALIIAMIYVIKLELFHFFRLLINSSKESKPGWNNTLLAVR